MTHSKMMTKKKAKNTGVADQKRYQRNYKKFEAIDGSHPFKQAVPEGFVDYPARVRKGGKVAYFNYALAKEMGLIPSDHPEKMNKELEAKIVETFAIVIVNEFDEMNGRSFPKEDMKSGTYMATRYLQLQHEDKTGRASGDGRSVWNGQVKNRGKVWDISSCGTGATRLSPATSKYNKFFETGDPSISYGCGYAELDEGLATALFSDIFKRNGVQTEETLCVLEFEKNYSVNVRAHSSLLRPSHFFGYLKQGNWEALARITDYYIDSRRGDADFRSCPKGSGRYEFLLNLLVKTFAQTVADFEDEYIFCWLDWDGDNILMDGGIIDYGSVRQFGLFHHEYRYDDVERFSTNIIEQKDKAKKIVQTFAQMTDFLLTKEKKKIGDFKNHQCIELFERIFEERKNENILGKMGFSANAKEALLKKGNIEQVLAFRKDFAYFERAKSSKGLVKVSDGITWDAIFCMRDLLRDLPQLYLSRNENISEEEFVEIMRSNYAQKEDLQITSYRKRKIKSFQDGYWNLVRLACAELKHTEQQVLLEMSMRSSVINKAERVTGDAITLIIESVIKKKKSLGSDEIYGLFKKLVALQSLDTEKSIHQGIEPGKGVLRDNMMRRFFQIVKERREGL